MSEKKTNRRDFLFTATYAVGAVGVGATVWPMIDQMNPDASVKALASTEVDVSSLTPGKTITVLWRGKPVFIRRRTEDEIADVYHALVLGAKDYILKNKFSNHCWRMWSSAVVTSKGGIVPCCFDKDAVNTLGDLEKENFEKRKKFPLMTNKTCKK